MKTTLAAVSRSMDPNWVRWIVTTANESVWFYTRGAAVKYADLIRLGESDKAAQFAQEHVNAGRPCAA